MKRKWFVLLAVIVFVISLGGFVVWKVSDSEEDDSPEDVGPDDDPPEDLEADDDPPADPPDAPPVTASSLGK